MIEGGTKMSNEARVAVVTGASGGIGSAIVKKFYENGYSVAMCDINEEALKAVAADLKLDEARVAICPVNITEEEHGKIIKGRGSPCPVPPDMRDISRFFVKISRSQFENVMALRPGRLPA